MPFGEIRQLDNIIAIIDTIVILAIIIVTIYSTKKRKKSLDNDNHINNGAYIDEQKGFVVESSIKKNLEKYGKIKGFIKSFFLGPIIIMGPILLGVFLYEIVTNSSDAELPLDLIIFFVLLVFYIFIFIKTKKNLDKLENNFLYKIIKIFVTMFISLLIMASILTISSYICNKLKLGYGLSSLVKSLFIFLSLISGFLSFCFIGNLLLTTNGSSKKSGSNESTGKETINKQSDELTNDKITYDELIKANKSLEKKTKYHQGSLFKHK